MKYLDEYRDPILARRLLAELGQIAGMGMLGTGLMNYLQLL